MKPVRSIFTSLFVLGGFVALFSLLHAQETATSTQSSSAVPLTASSVEDVSSLSDMAVELKAIELTTPLPAIALTNGGNFYSAQHAPGSAEAWPPMPCNLRNTPVWPLGGDCYLLADLNVDYDAPPAAALAAGGMRAMAMGVPSPEDGGGDGGFTPSFSLVSPLDTNGLWLEITNVSNGWSYLNLHNATNQVYAIWSKTDLTQTNWSIETEVWPTNGTVMPFTVPTLNRQNLFFRAEDWTGVTENGNTTPDWWFWMYFGTTALSDTNLDSQGNTLLYDYQNGLDPNSISFAIVATNSYVNTTEPTVQLDIFAGFPAFYAVLVNDTNQADAVWQPYTSSNLVVTLGTDGSYDVSIGLRGHADGELAAWQDVPLTKDTVPPVLTITNPAAGTVTQPMIQVQGYANEPLAGIRYDLSNAAGSFTGQAGYTTGQFYDTNLLAFTTNYFQCYDVPVTNGLNVITIHAFDLAGNETSLNLNRTLDYFGTTNPPVLTVVWPQDGALVSGTNFTLQAAVDDDTAQVTATITDTNGDTNLVVAVVERNGQVWVSNLPLGDGTNAVTLAAMNAAGNVSTTSIHVVKNDVGLIIWPLESDQLNQSAITVYGMVGDPGDLVTVNGVSASVYDDYGDWEADGVPVSPTGAANLLVQVSDGSGHPLGAQGLNQPQPVVVTVAGYASRSHYQTYNPNYNEDEDYANYSDSYTVNWTYTGGGAINDISYNKGTSENDYHYNHVYSLSAGEAGLAQENGFAPYISAAFSAPITYEFTVGSENEYAQTRTVIQPQGTAVAGQVCLYLVEACAAEYADPLAVGYGASGDVPLPPAWLQIQGQTLAGTGQTNADGSVWGATVVTAPAGTTPEVTPTATQHYAYNYYSFTNQAFPLTLQSLTVVSNSATQIDATNWAVVKSPTNDYVIVQATLNFTNDWVVTNAAFLAGAGAAIQWTGGEAVPGSPLQRRVTKTNSVETTVTASLGSSSTNLNVWVVWNNLTISTSGTIDSGNDAVNLTNHDWPSYLGGGNGLGPIDCLSNPNLTYAFTIGKMQAKSTLAPAGVENVITNGWHLHRHAQFIAWDNGLLSASDTGNFTYDDTSDSDWMDQNPRSGISTREIYDIDGPGCPIHGGTSISHTAEIYDNFKEFATVTLGGSEQPCSNTNTWSCTAQIDADKSTNKVELNSVTTSLITLPTSPHYSQR